MLFRRELDRIARRRGARVHYLLARDPDCLSAPTLLRLVPDLTRRDVYLCGPPRMADAVRGALRDAGLPVECLHEDRFRLLNADRPGSVPAPDAIQRHWSARQEGNRCGKRHVSCYGLMVGQIISADAMAVAVDALRRAGCVFAEDEAAILADAASDEDALSALVRLRAAGEPLEQVVGYADFCGVRVRLRPGVFVPRVRSELLVRLGAEAATRRARAASGRRGGETGPVVVDLCCGSGALGMALAARVPGSTVYAADVDPVAVACARDNLGHQVYLGDLYRALPTELRGRVDVLLANVPYVATRHIPLLPAEARDHEPRAALDGGDDGLDVLRRVVAEAPQWLAPGGIVLSETTEAQVGAATAAIENAGLRAEVAYDDDREARVVIGHR